MLNPSGAETFQRQSRECGYDSGNAGDLTTKFRIPSANFKFTSPPQAATEFSHPSRRRPLQEGRQNTIGPVEKFEAASVPVAVGEESKGDRASGCELWWESGSAEVSHQHPSEHLLDLHEIAALSAVLVWEGEKEVGRLEG